jgi:hydroxymethylpyrimidine/phosphomethylpyrimidine kinase
MRKACVAIARLGVCSVLVKGGHLAGDAIDVLWSRGAFYTFRSRRIRTKHTHGTGCAVSAAITAELAKKKDLVTACRSAKKFVTSAIRTGVRMGSGMGPINYHAMGRARSRFAAM